MSLLVILAILGIVYGYTGWRLAAPLPYPTHVAPLIFLLASIPISFIWLRRRATENGFVDAYAWATYLSMGYVTVTFGLLLLRDVAWLAGLALTRLIGYAGMSAPAATDTIFQDEGTLSQDLLLLTNAGVMALGFLFTGLGIYHARRQPRVKRVTVPLGDLPPDLDGLTIGQISDVHAGTTIKRRQIERIVEALAPHQPDLIALTGDLADQSVERLRPHVEPLARLRAPLGCFFVTGNHEYYAGVGPWLNEVRRLGFRTLLNEHVVIQRGSGRIVLAGTTDLSAGQETEGHASDVGKALAEAPDGLRILLAHQPGTIEAAEAAGVDLQLSGHTHGGQFPPWKYVVSLHQPYAAGLHRRGNTWIYVNRGAGYWGPPIRLGAPSEVTLLTLVRR